MGRGILKKYAPFLPITPQTPHITLGEGDTPLVRSAWAEKEVGGEVYFKLEGCNPSGSFKDRGIVMAVAKALEEGSQAVVCASTGNTSASAAAYGARCGLRAIVLVPGGKVASGKLAQAIIYGARVVPIAGSFDQAFGVVRALVERHPLTLVNSINPYRIEGQKTAAFEIVDELGEAPDYLFIPVGSGGNITAYWRGFQEYQKRGKARGLPKMMGFEAEGAAPIVRGQVIPEPETIASAIRIGNPAHWQGALRARQESGGVIDWVSDQEILASYQLLANKEGIFGEPASAASVAGLLKLARSDHDFRGKRIVCIITGAGLKDPDLPLRLLPLPTSLPPELEAVEKALGW